MEIFEYGMAFLLIGFGIIVYFKFSRVGLHERVFEGRNNFFAL